MLAGLGEGAYDLFLWPRPDRAPHGWCRCASRRTASLSIPYGSLRSDHSQFPIGSRVVVGHRAANRWKPEAAEG